MTLIIEGYASRFNLRDLNDDVVVGGAFRDTLVNTGVKGVRMLYQHQGSSRRSGCGMISARTPLDFMSEDGFWTSIRRRGWSVRWSRPA